MGGDGDLAEVGVAGSALAFFFGATESWEEKSGEDCNNGDDDEKFDEGKRARRVWFRCRWRYFHSITNCEDSNILLPAVKAAGAGGGRSLTAGLAVLEWRAPKRV